MSNESCYLETGFNELNANENVLNLRHVYKSLTGPKEDMYTLGICCAFALLKTYQTRIIKTFSLKKEIDVGIV